jgi:hypothetical protein
MGLSFLDFVFQKKNKNKSNNNNQNQNQNQKANENENVNETKNENVNVNVEEKKDNGGGEKKNKESNPNAAVFKIDMHCEGCATKIVRCVKDFEGISLSGLNKSIFFFFPFISLF